MGKSLRVRGARTMFAVAAAVAVMGSAAVEPATAAYQYTPVASSAGALGTQFGDHALGNNGYVAFNNLRDDGQYAVYRWNGTSLQTVAETGPALPGWTSFVGTVGINGSSQVSFYGLRVASPTEIYGGIYRGEPAGSVTNISEVSTDQSTTAYILGTDVNAGGTVAYQRRVVGTSRGIYTSNGTSEQTIYIGTDADSIGFWSINSSGQVAISGTIGGVTGVWRGTGDGTLTPIATSNFTQVRTPIIDDAGGVTFTGTLTNGTNGVYRGDGGTLETLADTSAGSPFDFGFARSSANNDGDTAFLARPTGGSTGIYFLPNGAETADAQKVIGIGDSLFGGTVQTVLLAPRGLNDADEVAFMYRLTDDTWGIAVAAIPEPASAVSLSLLGLAALQRRRSRR
ncbi:MAG TPA: choice-of-anchor tandem repeat NxxGxxAF-containing protein [Tepidisphaeraceae bacterium]|nr:choice-of-anchor tandem repeat NxxGxxAF-containing protein [Tepidisphaeraceae bacterium]